MSSEKAIRPPGALADGFHKLKHGRFEITVLSDGYITLTSDILMPDGNPEDRRSILGRLGGDADSAPLHTNIPLIRHGNDLILVDTGAGGNFQPSDGRLAENLSSFGVDPASITRVVFTHVHPDHSGGTTKADGSLLFPNAHYYVNEAEWSFWTDPDYEQKMPEALHAFARGAQRDLFAVKDTLTMVKPGDEIVSGMNVVSTRGHTPGHISLELAGDGSLMIAGDVIPNNIFSFENPKWHFGFDTEPEIALTNRAALLDKAANERLRVLGYHWTYPGVGYVERNGTAYRFQRG
ncbi:MBL fold metallo-hydrolase [Rhizobium leguminosarum]|uniref:MBL fold metallo-hydrolase n=1 Tax=Rhizobium leguminosarum TaxID=384 RepID=UPI0010300A1C|nr:MBL fold metallo-hydrolase [Rhizobium leguminosarum]QIO76284.1 MBL fold metallo-hydrolase [Rhizobium leguminosarum bv. trifolii]QIO83303.1 MBL fold metallo-hydrolase [Rhizobium leguminosarum bv. trifolii]TAU16441.1 MBL fold metallo-hydrolase [Rhizobium leguminosarum]TAU34864.1 MBL fold metallo-hydrolase [Rhizobium leguminosarum]TAX43956.1 MBL fold metallo-hydrolase [Rhizobium leguminosarum]